ncbi:MAG: MerR family transcriptional regulator [Gemmatimonadetes bacterium]|nr:MerR family transcriptional regulator [Gemmatimonadota bacterium]
MNTKPTIQVDAAVPGHPIAVVAERTGLSRDVLRVWERRYGAVEPGRTAGGQRLYSDEDVNRFRLLAEATRHGRSIRHVAGMSTTELATLVATDAAERPVRESARHAESLEATVEVALRHVRSLDGTGLDRVLRRTLARHGLPAFTEDLVPHLMHRIGDAWATKEITVAHEHLASAAVLAVLFEAIRSLPEPPAARKLLVATPAGEYHAVGAALAATVAALDGWVIVYLGTDVPSSDIVSAASAAEASAVLLSAVHTDLPEQLVRRLRALRAELPASVPIVIGGAAAHTVAGQLADAGLVVCDNFAAMRDALAPHRMAT